MHIIDYLHSHGVGVFPCRADKSPAVPRGVDWRDVAKQPPSTLQWPSGLFGISLPFIIVILDLDTYKGITRQIVESMAGGPIPWDAAFIQTTLHGGQHYAFRVPAWTVKQGSNIGIPGLDTRVGGKGFICSGEGYVIQGSGLIALAHPETLPVLPDSLRPLLEDKGAERAERAESAAQAASDTDTEIIKQALLHIDPECGRQEWLRVGMALRHHFGDDDGEGLDLFDEWSSGRLTGTSPHNYVPDHMEHQWGSFKPSRDGQATITIATLFYDAMERGWTPPSTFDTSMAFGEGAAPPDVFNGLLTRIQESGTDLNQVLFIVDEIVKSGCNALQRDLLALTLYAGLKEIKVLDTSLKHRLDDLLRPDAPALKPRSVAPMLPEHLDIADLPVPQLSQPSAVHGVNARLMLTEIFSERLAVKQEQLRWWTGREWQTVPDFLLNRICYQTLLPDQSKEPVVNGTKKALRAAAPILGDCAPDTRIYFRDGVFNMETGMLEAHSRNNANTGTLTVDSPFTYAQEQLATVEWLRFIDTIFGNTPDTVERTLLLQEIMGYALFKSDLNVQKIIALDGASRAGKGVILTLLQELVGVERMKPFTFSDLNDKKNQASMRDPDIVCDMDAKPPGRGESKAAIGFMNKVVSNEPVSVPLLYSQETWTGRLNTKIYINCNGIPTLLDDSGATTNRFVVLYFTRTFAGHEDRGLLNRLRGELPGIAAWAMEGAARLVHNNGQFTSPSSSIEAINELKQANQPMETFIQQWLIFDRESKALSRDLWHAYKLYCIDENISLPTKRAFSKSLKQALLGTNCQYQASMRVGDEASSGYEGVRLREVDGTNVTPLAPVTQAAFVKK